MKLLTAAMAGMAFIAGTLNLAHAGEKHLFYVHGCCVQGPNDPKVRDYEKIVQSLKDAGFKIHFELRPANPYDNNPESMAYAEKIAGMVKDLIARGAQPGDITVAGYSHGSRIAAGVSGLVANPRVNYVLLAGCPMKHTIPVDYARVTGRVLSIRDSRDDKFESCDGRLPGAAAYKEIVLESGQGHALFRLADEKYLKLWMEPLTGWARGE
jgi:hypothetical protein